MMSKGGPGGATLSDFNPTGIFKTYGVNSSKFQIAFYKFLITISYSKTKIRVKF